MRNFRINIGPAGGLSPSGARPSVDTMMTTMTVYTPVEK